MKIVKICGLLLGLLLGGCVEAVVSGLDYVSNSHLAYHFPGTVCTPNGCVDESSRRVRVYSSTPSTYGKMAGTVICKQVLATGEQTCIRDEGSVILGAPNAPTKVEPYHCKPLDSRTDCYGYSNQPRKYKNHRY